MVHPSWETLPGVATNAPTSYGTSVSTVLLAPPLTVEWEIKYSTEVSLCGSGSNPTDVPSRLVSMRVAFSVPF